MSIDQDLRQAIAAIAEGDSELITLCERDERLLIELGAFTTETKLPILVMDLRTIEDGTGQVLLELIGCAEGNDAGAKARALCARVPELFTALAFQDQGVAMLPMAPSFRTLNENENQGLQLVLNGREGSPLWQAAVCTLPLVWIPDTL